MMTPRQSSNYTSRQIAELQLTLTHVTILKSLSKEAKKLVENGFIRGTYVWDWQTKVMDL